VFGLVKPELDALSPPQRRRHRRYYCGLCHGVGVHVGHTWRGVHSHDAVFLATLVDGLVDAPAAPSSCRCPMLPVVHRHTRDPSSVALRFAVGAQLLLADQWVADKAVEGSRAARFARDVLQAPVGRGRAVLLDLGVDPSPLDGFEGQQHAVECTRPGLTAAAEPTAAALAWLLAQVPSLPGGPDGAHTPALRTLGHALGRVIYAIDALEDLDDDARDGSFNPCLGADDLPDASAVSAAARLLDLDRARLLDALQALPFHQNHDLVQATVQHLLDRADRALDRARERTSTEGRSALARWINQPAWVHAAAALLTALTASWAAVSTTARAAPDQLALVRSQVRQWFLPQAQQCPCDDCDKCCEGCEQCGEGCEKCGEGCESCNKGCQDCNKNCTSCCDGCNDCMSGCGFFLPG